jgi:cyanate permease
LFNGITTWVENIIRPRGFSPTDAGTLGAMLLVGGVLGAVIIPPFSDRQKKRVKFLFLGIILSIPGLVGLTFARELWLLLVSAFTLGFFLISTSPIGMQYAAEITYPTPEGTSNGILQLFGQISVVFVYIMEAMKTRDGSFTPSLLLSIGLLLLCLLIITRLKDPGEIVPTTQTKSQDPHVQVP